MSMKNFLFLFLIPMVAMVTLAACGTMPRRTLAPSTAPVARSIQAASVGTVRAQASVQKMRVSLRAAQEAAAVLAKTATPQQRPVVAAVQASLKTARAEIQTAGTQLIAVSSALHDSDARATALQQEVDTLAADRDAQAAKAGEYGNAYHRLKFWLALAAAGMAFLLTLNLVPPLVPYRWGIASGAAAAVFGATWLVL